MQEVKDVAFATVLQGVIFAPRDPGVARRTKSARGGNSGVRGYRIGEDYIDVMFSNGALYRYSYRSAGASKIEEMKRLAMQGQEFSSFIKKYANNNYEYRIRQIALLV